MDGSMKHVYVMLTQTGTYIARSIRYFTKDPYNHASISIDDTLFNFWTFSRRVRRFPLIGGFVREQINRGIFPEYPQTRMVIYAIPISDEAYHRLQTILRDYIHQHRRWKYNFAAIFGGLINRPFQTHSRHTCSEFVSVILQKSGICTFNKPSPLIRPSDLMDLPNSTVLYEGLMTEYAALMTHRHSFQNG